MSDDECNSVKVGTFNLVIDKLLKLQTKIVNEQQAYESLFQDYLDMEKTANYLENEVKTFNLFLKDEKNKSYTANLKYLSLKSENIKCKQKGEKQTTKEIVRVFLTILLKENLICSDRKTIIGLIKIYRHLTNENLKKCKSEVEDIIACVSNSEILEESISLSDIETKITEVENSHVISFDDKENSEKQVTTTLALVNDEDK